MVGAAIATSQMTAVDANGKPRGFLAEKYAQAREWTGDRWNEFATGTPVVTSTAPALRETGGEFGLYADPGSPMEIAEQVVRALSAESQSCGEAAARQLWARRYTWDESGRMLAGAFKSVL